MMVFALLLPVPQLYVVTLETSSRVCEQPLLDLAIASIVLTFFTIGNYSLFDWKIFFLKCFYIKFE